MMKLLNIVVLGISVVFMSCPFVPITIGNGNVVSQERLASDFSGVTHEGLGDVNIYYAENYKVVVTTDSDIQHLITTEANGNNLRIGYKGKINTNIVPTRLTIDVYMPELRNINLTGYGNIDAQNYEAENVVVTHSGTGNIKIISGKTVDLRMHLSGYGNIDAQNYEAENVVVTHSGTGEIKTWVTESFAVNLSGYGNVLYRGNPPIVNVHTTGIGKVRRL
jgi:hypothetical protein